MFRTMVKTAAVALLLSANSALAQMELVSYEAGLFVHKGIELLPGQRVYNRPEEIIRTTKVPAKLGTKFGIRFTVTGKKAKDNIIHYFYLSPGVIDEKGVRHDKYEVVQDLSTGVDSHVVAFEFSEAYEVVPGEWELFVFEEDRLLVRESFIVSEDATGEGEVGKEEDLTPYITPVERLLPEIEDTEL